MTAPVDPVGHAERLSDGQIRVSGGSDSAARRAAERIAEGRVRLVGDAVGITPAHHPIRWYEPKPTSIRKETDRG